MAQQDHPNAHLVAAGLRVAIEGKPNQFKRPGRPRSVFAPKSARIVRRLLIDPERTFSQRALAKLPMRAGSLVRFVPGAKELVATMRAHGALPPNRR